MIPTDVCGPMQTKTPRGNRYYVSFIDDYSWCAVIQLLENKNQVKTALSAFVSTMETQFNKKIKTLRSDRGGEFWNQEMQSFCASNGIVHQKTNPYSSQENGVAERLNRTLMEKARAMLQGSSQSDEY
jgi:transposase InsO family protein